MNTTCLFHCIAAPGIKIAEEAADIIALELKMGSKIRLSAACVSSTAGKSILYDCLTISLTSPFSHSAVRPMISVPQNGELLMNIYRRCFSFSSRKFPPFCSSMGIAADPPSVRGVEVAVVVVYQAELLVVELAAPAEGLGDVTGSRYSSVWRVSIGSADVARRPEHLADVLGQIPAVTIPRAVFLNRERARRRPLRRIPSNEPEAGMSIAGQIATSDLEIPPVDVPGGAASLRRPPSPSSCSGAPCNRRSTRRHRSRVYSRRQFRAAVVRERVLPRSSLPRRLPRQRPSQRIISAVPDPPVLSFLHAVSAHDDAVLRHVPRVRARFHGAPFRVPHIAYDRLRRHHHPIPSASV